MFLMVLNGFKVSIWVGQLTGSLWGKEMNRMIRLVLCYVFFIYSHVLRSFEMVMLGTVHFNQNQQDQFFYRMSQREV